MAAQTQAPFDPPRELKRSATQLLRHPILVLPTAFASASAIVLVFGTVFATIFAAWTTPYEFGARLALPTIQRLVPALTVGAIAIALGFTLATLVTLCAAPEVLEDRPVDWRWAIAQARSRFGQFALLLLIYAAAGIIVLPLCLILIGIPLLLASWYFLMYATAAVAVGGEGAVQAIRTSARIARTHVPESIVAWLGIVAALVLGSIANATFGYIPFLNVIAAFVIGGYTASYAELVRARFYLVLRGPGVVTTLAPKMYVPPA